MNKYGRPSPSSNGLHSLDLRPSDVILRQMMRPTIVRLEREMLSRNPFRQGKTKYLLWNENPLFEISSNPALLKTHGESFVRIFHIKMIEFSLLALLKTHRESFERIFHIKNRVLTIAVLLKAPIADPHKKWRSIPIQQQTEFNTQASGTRWKTAPTSSLSTSSLISRDGTN